MIKSGIAFGEPHFMKALRWDAGKGAPSGNPNEFARNKKSPLRNRSVRGNFCWWAVRGSNPRQPACKAGALPTELTARGFLVEDRTLRVNGQGARSRTTTGCLPPEGAAALGCRGRNVLVRALRAAGYGERPETLPECVGKRA